jgi:PleD family two-component response regulator
MSDTIDLAWIGTTLRSIQAEQRTIRGENQLIRSALSEAITLLMNRIGNFEAYMDTRFDQAVKSNADGLAIVIERLDRIEQGLAK